MGLRRGESGALGPLPARPPAATLAERRAEGVPRIRSEESEAVTDTVLTANGLEKLEAESARLRAERETIVERLRSALEFGGAFAENGEYLDARHELDLVDRRLALLERRLFAAEIVVPRPDGQVDLGERVTVVDLESGETIDYRVVGAGESDPAAGEISNVSPIGTALLGRCVGDVVEADAPRGRRRLEIVDLDG